MKLRVIKKYLIIGLKIMRRDLILNFTYRAQFWGDTLGSIIWSLVYLAFIKIIFNYTDLLANWSYWQILLIFCFQQLNFYFIYIFIMPSLREFHDQIRKGNFDFIINKPLDSQFFSSVQKFTFSVSLCFVIMLIFLGYILQQLNWQFNWLQIIITLYLFCCSVIIVYACLNLIACLSFWFIRAEALTQVWFETYNISEYPRQIYHGWLKFIFCYILPFLLFFNLPAEAIQGIYHWPELLFISIFTLAITIFNRWFWNLSIKHYSSASS